MCGRYTLTTSKVKIAQMKKFHSVFLCYPPWRAIGTLMKKVIRTTMMSAILLLGSLSFLPYIYSGGADENSKADENSQAAENSKAKEDSTWEQFKDMIKRSSYDTFVLPFEFLWDAVRGFPEESRPTSGDSPPSQSPPKEGSTPSGHSSGGYVPPSSSYGLPNAYSIDKAGLVGPQLATAQVVKDLNGGIKNEMNRRGLGDQKDQNGFDASDAIQGGVDGMAGNRNPGVDTRSMQSSNMTTPTSTSPTESGHDHDAFGKEHY